MNITSPEILIAALAFACVMCFGIVLVMVFSRRRNKSDQRLSMARLEPIGTEERKKASLAKVFEKIGNFVSHGQASTDLWEQLIRAGYFGRQAPAVYMGAKMLFFGMGAILTTTAVVLMPNDMTLVTKLVAVVVGAAVFFFVPNLFILQRDRTRQEEVRHSLPDAIDLLEICVSSGIGLDMAWNMVANEFESVSPILASAMDLSNFEMHLGVSRAESMRNMAARTGADQLSSLAAILIQSERFGTSVGEALRTFATSMREERTFIAEEQAERMSVKLIIPMVLFIFPAIIIVVIGPAVIKIAAGMLSGM